MISYFLNIQCLLQELILRIVCLVVSNILLIVRYCKMSRKQPPPPTEARPINSIMSIKSNEDLRAYLQDRPELNLSLLKQKNQSTLLHFAAFKNELSKLKIYVLHFEAFARQNLKHNRNDPSFQNQLKAWINVQNKDGFTALHFAGLHGNIQMIEFLQRYGANMQARTHEDEDVLFMAVQNNHLKTTIYLLEYRDGKIPFNANRPNHIGDTLLHKSAIAGFIGVSAYLLSLSDDEINRDAQNNDGWTALMYAVKGGYKEIVKRMLLKGVNRHIKNNEEQKALNIARGQGMQTMVRILNDEFTYCEKLKIGCNLKVVYKVEKPSRSYSIIFLIFFHLIFLPSNALTKIQLFSTPYLFYGLIAAFYLLTIIVFILLTIKHPRGQKQDLLEAQLPVCPQCRHSVKPNQFHCFICGVCVSRYDHHCPWINNCVSVYNIGKFTFFLVLLILATAQVLFLSLSLQTEAFLQIKRSDLLHIPQDIMSKLVLGNVLICGSLSVIICISVFSVLGEQLKNLASNSTSYERAKNATKKKKASLLTANQRSSINQNEQIKESEEAQEQESDDQNGCVTNCCAILSEKYGEN